MNNSAIFGQNGVSGEEEKKRNPILAKTSVCLIIHVQDFGIKHIFRTIGGIKG